MKIHILFDIRSEPNGGGNQFLRGLKEYFESQSVYAEVLETADIIIFNSHHHINTVARMKRAFPAKLFIHRIDGPMRLYNQMSDRRDYLVNNANQLIADGTVFQSAWSRKKNLALGLTPTNFETVIHNALDTKIFNANEKSPFNSSEKIRLIAVSWSLNKKKGFDVYQWLDENLDFDRYEMSFLGNSPVKFKNIKLIPAAKSQEGVAQKLKESDIYITASQKDPCSNSLIEALNCGLPVVALNDGGHPELVGGSGELYDDLKNIPQLLEKIVKAPINYSSQSSPRSIAEAGNKYSDFAQQLMGAVRSENYQPKTLSLWNYIKLEAIVLL